MEEASGRYEILINRNIKFGEGIDKGGEWESKREREEEKEEDWREEGRIGERKEWTKVDEELVKVYEEFPCGRKDRVGKTGGRAQEGRGRSRKWRTITCMIL